jgi:peptide/nickel transport system permease protein
VVPTLFGASVLVFALVHLTGDPALLMLSPLTPPEQVEAFRREFGYNDPIAVQYWRFLVGALQGDLGDSIRFRQPALGLAIERLPATVELASLSTLLAVLVGVPAGVLSAVHNRAWYDALIRGVLFLGQGIPPFWLGLVLIVTLSVQLGVLPSGGRGSFSQLIMPVTTLAVYLTASFARFARNGMIQVLSTDYIRTARAKGLGPGTVNYKHALRNTLIPLITLVGLQLGHLLGGAVVTETIFAWPGVGRLIVNAIYARDFPVVQAALLIVVALFVFVNLLVDLLYGLIDPTIRYA